MASAKTFTAMGLSCLLLAACSSGSSSSGSSGMGTVNVSMTDAPACGYDHVYVTVAAVSINSAADGSGSWTDIDLAAPEKIDLLSLTNGALETLGQASLPAGTYQQLRLVLSPNTGNAAPFSNSVVPSGQTDEIALKTPSAAQSGLKINTRSPFTVAPGTLVDLVLDFNACQSIVTTGASHSGNGNSATGYLLKPVITAVPTVVSGAIDGYVDAADATTTANGVTTPGAQVWAEQNGVIVAGTTADSNGYFILSPLEQSSANGTYDVVIVNNGKATDIVQSVPVAAQVTTSLSTAAAPFTLLDSDTGIVNGTVNPAASAALDAAQTVNGVDEIVATTNADSSTGSYALTLPVAAPQAGMYAATLPIALSPVDAVAAQYTLTATSAAGNTASSPVAVTAGGTVTIDFSDLQ